MKFKSFRTIMLSITIAIIFLLPGCEFNTYIVTNKKPEQSIARFFDCLQKCDFDGCDKYLANNMSFDISNDTGYEFVEVVLKKQMSSLKYGIVGQSNVNGGNASCRIQITSLNVSDIQTALIDVYTEARREYMKQNNLKEFPVDDKNVINEIAENSFNSIAENIQPTTKDLTVNLIFTDGRWKIILDDALCDAVLGGSL